jgi:hypothetical protein
MGRAYPTHLDLQEILMVFKAIGIFSLNDFLKIKNNYYLRLGSIINGLRQCVVPSPWGPLELVLNEEKCRKVCFKPLGQELALSQSLHRRPGT